MKTPSILQRYHSAIDGVLECYDRIIINGTLPAICHPGAMAAHLKAQDIPISEYSAYAQQLTDKIHRHARAIAAAAGLKVEFLTTSHDIRKEEHIAQILTQRGTHPGLVHVLEVMETCETIKPKFNKSRTSTHLSKSSVRCAVFYFYYMHAELGLIHIRVPTWAPFRLQIYCNGHNWLASQLRQHHIDYEMADNCFTHIADWARAQELSNNLKASQLQDILKTLSHEFCPIPTQIACDYHWSISQIEYSLDIAFKDTLTLPLLYEELSRQAMLAVHIADMTHFWDKPLSPEAQATSDYRTWQVGTCIKHRLGKQTIKMYDKAHRVLRIEATSNDITFFRHHRKVESPDGTSSYKNAPLKKSIHSLSDLTEILSGACHRYLSFISALEDNTPSRLALEKVSAPVRDDHARSWRGFNLFREEDQKILTAIMRGEFTINGMSNKRLRAVLGDCNASRMSRILRRLRLHNLIKKVGKTYHYYVTALGKALLAGANKLINTILLPELQPEATT